jgi:hypothetical protein
MPRPRAALLVLASALSVMSAGACRKDGESDAPGGSSSSSGAGAAAAEPAKPGSYADLAQRFAQATAQPNGAEEAKALAGPLLDAASKRLRELSIEHEVVKTERELELRIKSDRTSALGRLAEGLRERGDTRLVYDVAFLRDHADRRVGYDEQTNLLRMTHAVILRGGDVEEPTLRHEQARAEAWEGYRRGEPSPYHAKLVDGTAGYRPHYVDELHANARDMGRELQGMYDRLLNPDDAPLTQGEFSAVLAAQEKGAPLERPLTDVEASWDRLVAAGLRAERLAVLLDPALRQAEKQLKGKGGPQFAAGPRGATATVQVEVKHGDAAPESVALFFELTQSAGPEDPKNAAMLREQVKGAVQAAERHGAHAAAIVEILRRIAATSAGAERRVMLKALGTVITPAAADAPAKARAKAAYIEAFEAALPGGADKKAKGKKR